MNDQQTAALDWKDGEIPVSVQFDDPYFSLAGGLAETRYVFLQGNDLPARFRDGFHIAELGFGTGLNLMATIALWKASGQTGILHFTTFEAFPMAIPDMERALSAFPEVADDAPALLAALAKGPGPHDLPCGVRFTMITGDARASIGNWDGAVDAWFLDGFSPAKNPEMWEEPLMQAVAARLKPGGTLATYTAAGFVRRALTDAGVTVERIKGYANKRHMTRGFKPL